jgi:hypothetical protein
VREWPPTPQSFSAQAFFGEGRETHLLVLVVFVIWRMHTYQSGLTWANFMSLRKLSIPLALTFVFWMVSNTVSHAQLTDAPRPFAPGVLKVIPPDLRPEDSFSPPLRVPGITATTFDGNYVAQSDTLHGQSQKVVFYRDVWALEFATLGLRQIELKVRMPDGEVRRRNFFYLPYRIRNVGQSLTYEQVKEGMVSEFTNFKLVRPSGDADDPGEATDATKSLGPNRVLLQFTLEGLVALDDGTYERVYVRDHYLPEVARAIQQQEDPKRRLLNQQEMESAEVPVVSGDDAPGVWGVAVWEDVDPRLDYISVFVRGVTNAYAIRFNAAGEQNLLHKTLQLNYWRPGDTVEQPRDEIIYGIPYDNAVLSQIQICKHYQLPGPQLQVFLLDESVDSRARLATVESEIDPETLDSLAATQLNAGEFPESLLNELKGRGFEMDSASPIETTVSGSRWRFKANWDGRERVFEIRMKPEFWEKAAKDDIRFIKSLDHMWIYR